ncbi:MAG: hypothetical protein A3K23_06170 [Desulfobacca sp. RBG_16_58_9]|nr:MAG: hypothetical protein A3K23_06170 [Desulfobacca sp. RBG_16_58_9]
MNLDDAIVLETFTNYIAAEMTAGLLESEGVEARVVTDDGGGMYPSLRLTLGVRLMVYREDEARAREILAAMAEVPETDEAS